MRADFGCDWTKDVAPKREHTHSHRQFELYIVDILFSLVLMEFLDDLGPLPDLKLKLWYLDDGAFLGQRASAACLLDVLLSKGSSFGLHFNLNKCEVFWPSGD